jgi:hypothetical protein
MRFDNGPPSRALAAAIGQPSWQRKIRGNGGGAAAAGAVRAGPNLAWTANCRAAFRLGLKSY